jgi:choline dehydrogenase-like flavoprotein/predicted dehydrogenase
MKPSDLRDYDHDAVITTDVCVIGSGPAGATIALELAGSGVEVTVVESGGVEFEADTNALYDIDNVGMNRVPQHEVRVRQFGGTSTVWTGRCAPFGDIDYEARPWVPSSGWPFGPEAFAPYLGRAARYLGLAAMPYDRHAWSAITGKTPSSRLDPANVVDELWQFSTGAVDGQPVRINIDYADRLEAAPNISAILHANVLEIVPNAEGRQVDHVVVATLDGKQATTVVVCAGAIESARLLLASRSIAPAGLGNDRDLVGPYYMEHPYGEVGVFDLSDDMVALLSRFGLFWHDGGDGRRVFMSGLALSPRVQRERELLNCAMYVLPEESEHAAIHAARRLASGDGHAMHDVRTLLASPMELAQAAKRRQVDGIPPIPPPKRVIIGANAEQRPNPDSRITLSDQTDALGMPLSRVDWRMDDQELAITTMLGLVRADLDRNGLPVPKPHDWLGAPDWRANFVDTAHHSCSVRMSNDGSTGVTDSSGHVFGIDGLFVAGSALFPTVGTANPTLMLVAMAIKVADAARARHQASNTSSAVHHEAAPSDTSTTNLEPERLSMTSNPPNPPCRIGLIGSGHRAETIYLPALAALKNTEIVGFTSRTEDRRQAFGDICGAPGYQDADALVAATRPDLLVVAVADDVNEAMTRHLLASGIPMLVETPWSWSVGAGRDLLSAVEPHAVIGVAEQFPFLPLEQLRDTLISDGVLGQIQAVHNESASWDYHGIAQLRRYVGPMTKPTAVQAASFAPMLSDSTGEEPRARPGYSATITCENGAVISQRFINFYDPPLRFNHHLTIDGELGSMVDNQVRFLDRSSGDVVTADVQRNEEGGFLVSMSIDLGTLGTVQWKNPFGDTVLTDEQIAVASHVSAMVLASAGHGSPLYSPSDALADVEIMNAIELSAAHGGSVSLPVNVKREKLRKAASPEFVQANLGKIVGKIREKLGR